MKNINFSLILIFLTFYSCTEKHNSQRKKIPKVNVNYGSLVTKIDNTIWSIFQDSRSNYWFGSKENGLFFYDGKALRQFTIEDGLVSNEIRGLQEDSNGNIFIETMKGVSKFDGKSFKTLELKDEESYKTEWALNQSDLWFRIGFNKKGPYRYDGKYLHYLKFPKAPQEDEFYKQNSNESLRPYGLYSIYKDSNGFIWFGTSGLGACRYDGNKLSWHYEDQLQTTPNGGDFGTRAIFEDKDGLFWINNSRYKYEVLTNFGDTIKYKKEAGIGFLNENGQEEFPFFLGLEQDNDGDLWMVTYDNGIWRNNGKELIHYPIKDGEKDVLLFSIYKDNQGSLWLGTFNAGVYKFNGKSFDKFEW